MRSNKFFSFESYRIYMYYIGCKCSFTNVPAIILFFFNCTLQFGLIFLYDLSMTLAVTIE